MINDGGPQQGGNLLGFTWIHEGHMMMVNEGINDGYIIFIYIYHDEVTFCYFLIHYKPSYIYIYMMMMMVDEVI